MKKERGSSGGRGGQQEVVRGESGRGGIGHDAVGHDRGDVG